MRSTVGTVARPPGGRPLLLPPLVLAVFVILVSCDALDGPGPPSGEDSTIDRETFVSVYVDLRLEAIRSPDGTLPPGRREEVLRRHGVDRNDLLRFVEVHGERAQFMREVWAEAQERIERAREEQQPEDDTTSG